MSHLWPALVASNQQLSKKEQNPGRFEQDMTGSRRLSEAIETDSPIPTGQAPSIITPIRATNWIHIHGLTIGPPCMRLKDELRHGEITSIEYPCAAYSVMARGNGGILCLSLTMTKSPFSDLSRLPISTNASEGNKSQPAAVSSWTSLQSWDTHASQKSAVIPSVGGQIYWLEVQQQENSGGDHASVA